MWLYALTADASYGPSCKAVLEDVEQHRLEVLISAQVLSEIAGVLYRSFGVRDTTRHLEAVLSYPMEVIPVTAEVVRMAAIFSRDYGILPYDSIHVATAVASNAEAIVSADREFDKVKILKRKDPLSYQRTDS